MLVNKDGRPAGAKSYMWVYRTGHMYEGRQIILYEYQKTCSASHPREFLRGFSGICVTDGYQVYHTVEKEREDLKIAGCWSHYPRSMLFQENCQTQRKSAVLRFGSRIIITTFYLKNSGMLLFLSVCSKGLSMGNHLSFHNLSCLFIVSCVTSVYI